MGISMFRKQCCESDLKSSALHGREATLPQIAGRLMLLPVRYRIEDCS